MFQRCRTQNEKSKFHYVRVSVNTSRRIRGGEGGLIKTGERFKRVILFCCQNPSIQRPIFVFSQVDCPVYMCNQLLNVENKMIKGTRFVDINHLHWYA